MREADKQILTALQRGIEITSHPFQTLETGRACTQQYFQALDVLEVLERSLDEGLTRRFGGIFDSRHLGYKSVLCALDVSPEELEEKAALISAHPGVTHCYERSPVCRAGTAEGLPARQKKNIYPNLWFTLAMPADAFDDGWESLRSGLETEGAKLFKLPALRRFKIDVVFDLNRTVRNPVSAGHGIVPDVVSMTISAEEKELVRALDQQLPRVERPFAAVAEQLGQSEEWVLSTLRDWKEQGVLRRVGAVLYHRQAGFKANAMCVWPVAEDDLLRAGSAVAARPEVTHCYQRPRVDVFPFDLYGMIHTQSWDETEALFRDISESCGLSGGELFASGREFKKSSMRYFR